MAKKPCLADMLGEDDSGSATFKKPGPGSPQGRSPSGALKPDRRKNTTKKSGVGKK